MNQTSEQTDTTARTPIHSRVIRYNSFLRDDGRWDIEGALIDSKAYEQTLLERGRMAAGEPIHHMQVCLTIDDDYLIHACKAEMPATPFRACQPAKLPVVMLVGAKLGKGWRKRVDESMGGQSGCTHLRELLYGMGTAAIQTVGRYRAHQRREAGVPEPVMTVPRPPVGECLGWAFDGEVVKRFRPQFYLWPDKQT